MKAICRAYKKPDKAGGATSGAGRVTYSQLNNSVSVLFVKHQKKSWGTAHSITWMNSLNIY